MALMTSLGFINATKMCNSGRKQFTKWTYLQSSQELLKDLTTDLFGVEASEISSGENAKALQDGNHHIWCLPSQLCKKIQTFNLTDTEHVISGTYIHPDLIPSVARRNCLWSRHHQLAVAKMLKHYKIVMCKFTHYDLHHTKSFIISIKLIWSV